ncbi:hypothetical protein CFC21_037684 [Triticum aestivum]|uniref:Uncharacterized protein n=3 Tax=Triticum TaxID=4564 RepID=A0A9R0VQW0_TRITD|nr:hypothetical protein CFC21_037684 [Triticum aestivum]VAH68087.1 unnamed protein product [Triticum turgidum subsp. durum]
MPRYELALWDLLMVLAGWKKPSASLPFLEMRLVPMASTWPPVRVSLAAEEHEGACKRRNPNNM